MTTELSNIQRDMPFYVKNDCFHRFRMPAIDSNMYILVHEQSALIVDPNVNANALKILNDCNVKQIMVLLTHEHFDHISGVNWLRERFDIHVFCTDTCAERMQDATQNMAKFWDVLVMDKPEDVRAFAQEFADRKYVSMADETFSESAERIWNGHRIAFQKAPGHSPGGTLIFFDEDVVFTGDNLVNGKKVIYRLPGGNKREYLKKTYPLIHALSDDVLILPGHGDPGKISDLRKFTEIGQSV